MARTEFGASVNFLILWLENTWTIWQEAAPWLLVGLAVAGILKVWLPATFLQRWLGGRGLYPVLKAAVIGTPLPLCSCSVLPTAIQLRRSGASKASTVSFLVATPENGADSLALTYVLLGPTMTIIRPVAAIISAVATGLLTALISEHDDQPLEWEDATNTAGGSEPSCCEPSGCEPNGCGERTDETMVRPGQLYAGCIAFWQASMSLLDDIIGWLLIGIFLAATLDTLLPNTLALADAIAQWGSGILAMLVVLIISVPMYICATASTPVAASMLLAGISPGTVLVFLLAGPATNLASIGLLRQELGYRATAAYVLGIAATSIGLGLVVDMLLAETSFNPMLQIDGSRELLPPFVSFMSAILLVVLAVKPLRSMLGSFRT